MFAYEFVSMCRTWFQSRTGVDEDWDAVSCWRSPKHHNNKMYLSQKNRIRDAVWQWKYIWRSTVNLLERQRLKKKRAAENPPLTFFLTRFSSKCWSWSWYEANHKIWRKRPSAESSEVKNFHNICSIATTIDFVEDVAEFKLWRQFDGISLGGDC